MERQVPSTLAGEIQSLSAALAEAEWLHILFYDVFQGSLLDDSWRSRIGPFASVLRKSCTLDVVPRDNSIVVDAKGIFDTLGK